jgi:hypothetical protein
MTGPTPFGTRWHSGIRDLRDSARVLLARDVLTGDLRSRNDEASIGTTWTDGAVRDRCNCGRLLERQRK